jgi:alcohol dehydrogenase, propanol-preferring
VANPELISIVDGDESVRHLLTSLGFAVNTFASAEEYLGSDLLERADLMLDIRMPGLSGIEFQRELVPYRGIKKLRDARALGPGRLIGVFGIGGLGGYAVQYAKLLGGGAKVASFARNPDKLAIPTDYGADHIISVKGKSSKDIADELSKATGQGELDAIVDCAGAPEMMKLAFSLLSISGHYVDVELVGDRIDIPLFPRVSREQTIHGSFWGNNIDLSEVMALAAQDKIRHTIKVIAFDQINQHLDLLRAGDVGGRVVVKF